MGVSLAPISQTYTHHLINPLPLQMTIPTLTLIIQDRYGESGVGNLGHAIMRATQES